MPNKASQRSQARYGARISTAVTQEVFGALVAESKRLNRTIEHVVSEVLHAWYTLDWLPEQQAKKKPAS